MEYLFQYRVSSDITCSDPLNFTLGGIKLILYLHEKEILTKSKKLHVICEEENENKAHQKISNNLPDFQERLIFFKGEKIFINELELVLLSQQNEIIRDMFVQGIESPPKLNVDENYFDGFQKFLDMELTDNEKLAIHHLAVAIIEDMITDKFIALYLTLEDLIDAKKTEVKCDTCQAVLECPKGHGPKIYSVTKKDDIKKFLKEIDFFETDFFNIEPENLIKLRQKLFHSQRKKGGFETTELENVVLNLSLKLRGYFEKKIGIYTNAGSVIESFPATRCWYKFKAKNIKSKFEFDIPTLDQLNENPNTEDWWINTEK